MVLRKYIAVILSIVILSVLAYVFIEDFNEFKNFINREHIRFKEFVFLLENVKREEKLPLTESTLRGIIGRYGLEIKRIFSTENGYVVEVKEVEAGVLPKLIKELEKYGKISEFEAVDNTGKGKFFLKLKITRS